MKKTRTLSKKIHAGDYSSIQVGSVAGVLVVVTLYFILSVFSLSLKGRFEAVSPFWFATTVGTLGLIIASKAFRPLLLIGLMAALFGANLLFLKEKSFSALWLSAVYLPGNFVEMVLAAWLLRSSSLSDSIRTLRALAAFITKGVVIPGAVGALTGAATLSAATGGGFMHLLVNWISGAWIGGVAMMPFMLMILTKPFKMVTKACTSLLAISQFLSVFAIAMVAVAYVSHPFVICATALLWVGIVGRIELVTLSTLSTALVLTFLTSEGLLLVPASGLWWEDLLFYLSFCSTLLSGLFVSVSEEHQRRVALNLRQAERRLRAFYTETPALLLVLDEEGRVQIGSRSFLMLLGKDRTELEGKLFRDLLDDESVASIQQYLNGKSDIQQMPLTLLRSDNTAVEVLFSARWEFDVDRNGYVATAALDDVTERNHFQKRSAMAEMDSLTGLGNRLKLNNFLATHCKDDIETKQPFAIGFLDLDYFKQINDQFGHEVGDDILIRVANALRASLRHTDAAYRLGGDEFVFILRDVDRVDILDRIAANLLLKISEIKLRVKDLNGKPKRIGVHASVGIARYPREGDKPELLLQAADRAMYEAKRAGRGRYVIDPPELH